MWLAVENAVVAALAGVKISGQSVFATVKGRTSRDRKVLAESMGRELLPAAYVVVDGREVGEKNFRRAGSAIVTVAYACRSERGDDEARRGGTGVVGMFALAEAAGAVLQDLDLGTNGRLLLVDERSSGGNAGTVLWEQVYEVRTRSGEYRPAFGGYWLVGDAGEVQVEVGSLSRASTTFSFPGVDGVFERFVGTRERLIVWRGQLRASDDSELNGIEQGLEELIRKHTVSSVDDSWGRMYENCVVRRFIRKGARRRDGLLGQVVQDFELEFAQLIG